MALRVEALSPDDTASLARKVASLLGTGDVVFLYGPLGSGKTFFVREAALSLGVAEPVTSPSFTLAQSYRGETAVNHLDLYRLESFHRDDYADFEPFFEGEAITFVEWPEPLENVIEPAISITIEHGGSDRRMISIDGNENLIKKLEKLVGDSGP